MMNDNEEQYLFRSSGTGKEPLLSAPKEIRSIRPELGNWGMLLISKILYLFTAFKTLIVSGMGVMQGINPSRLEKLIL